MENLEHVLDGTEDYDFNGLKAGDKVTGEGWNHPWTITHFAENRSEVFAYFEDGGWWIVSSLTKVTE